MRSHQFQEISHRYNDGDERVSPGRRVRGTSQGNAASRPFVSIVTPVYNGEKYLAECIESVLKQTYFNWEYIIVNNCSTDASLEIARKYERIDSRITVKSNEEFLKQIPNFNHAIRQISDSTTYCSLLMADDYLYPEFIERCVELAEQYPSMGIVSCYRLDDTEVKQVGIPAERTFLSGREVGRMKLLNLERNLFGSTSTFVLRAEIVRSAGKLFDESEVHADTDLVLRKLQEYDFGFVHQVLVYTRRHNESTTAFCYVYATKELSYLSRLLKYGRAYLTETEYQRALHKAIKAHHRGVIRRLFTRNGREVWRYHRNEMKRLGLRYKWRILPLLFFFEIRNRIFRTKYSGGNLSYSDNDSVRFKRNTTV